MKRVVGSFIVLVAGGLLAEGRLICHHDSYAMKDSFCYRYVVGSATYSQATERCERDAHATGMLYIDSASENSFIFSEMFSGHEGQDFWLGLDDQATEGDFRWSHNQSRPVYTNFSSDIEATNDDNYDCIMFTEGGWQVAQDFCENIKMPFICKAPVCESRDGVICDAVRVRGSEGGGLNVGIIAAIVIVILIIILIVVVLVVLVLLWKFKNDTFRHYICPCVGRGSKQALMSLQQENQRLRQELNQSKISTSSRFPPGHFGRESVSGVPDGMGGMLPLLKMGAGPRSPEPSSPTRPPPLSFQRGISRVTPMTPSGGPLFPPPPPVFTAQTQRSLRPSVSGGAQRGVAVGGVLAPLEEHEEDSSTASEDDTSLDKMVLPAADGVKGQAKPAETVDGAKAADAEVKGQGEASKTEDVQSTTGSKGQAEDSETKRES